MNGLPHKELNRRYYDRWVRLKENEMRSEARDGFMLVERMSQDEAAAIMGISRQAIHQIERKALAKIRHAMRHEIAEIVKDGF